MHEQPHGSIGPQDLAEPWIDGDVQDVLQSEILLWRDQTFGDGQAHQFGPNGTAYLALYAQTRTIEYYDPNTILAGRRAAKIILTPETVLFDLSTPSQHTFGMATPDGSFSWFSNQRMPVLDAGTQAVVDHLRASAERLNGGEGGRTRTIDQVAPDLALPATEPLSEPIISETVSETPAAASQKEKQTRVKVTGRLMRDVVLGQTSRGVPQVRFRLAEHPDPDNPDETKWRDCYSTKKHAERIAAQELRQGEEVRVTGLLHESEYADQQTGELKKREQIYAFGAKRTRPPRVD